MSTQHTPGPWEIDPFGKIHSKGSPAEISGVKCFPLVATVACYTTMRPEEVANARLIAAAPELLEALVRIVSEAGTDAGLDDEPGTINTIARNARAAIAKAKGANE